MFEKHQATRRIIVISDLHLGGDAPCQMSRPAMLAGFIERLVATRETDELLELVIAGDFVDFLAIEPTASFTADPIQARQKLFNTMRETTFRAVFTSLGKFVQAGHELTVLIGNHDVELALPPVQDALRTHLGASLRALRFVDDGRPYRIGRALIEHGNRYDNANQNDWTGLRAMASAFSRFEKSPVPINVSAGSKLVDLVVNPLKRQYPFIDLLQPQNELLALLLLAFEPGLGFHLSKIARVLHAKNLSDANVTGEQPFKVSAVGYEAAESTYDEELASVFSKDVYDQLYRPSGRVSSGEILKIAWSVRKDSLTEILGRGDPIPPATLKKIRKVMQRLLLSDDTDRLDGDTAQYGKAAERMISDSKGEVQAVLMGHTHHARCVGPESRATYINTGTWADIIRDSDELLTEFLSDLLRDNRPDIPRPYAELALTPDGAIATNTLKWLSPETTA